MAHSAETPYVEEVETALTVVDTGYGEKIEVVPFVRGRQEDGTLKLSLIRKVSPAGLFLEKRGWIPTVPNSFGLPPGETCPGQTEFCKSCYAFGSLQSKGVKTMLDGNLGLLESLESEDEMVEHLTSMVERYEQFVKSHDVPKKDRVFRIHWSGDFYSQQYAQAWARTIKVFPSTHFWAYTRSFREPVDVVPILDGIENLTLFLSTDSENVADIPEAYGHIRRANSALDVIHANEIARPAVKAITCPENLDRLKLMQDGEGACIKCRLCIKPEGPDINFVTSGKHDATPRARFAADTTERPVDISALTARGIKRVNHSRYITSRGQEQD